MNFQYFDRLYGLGQDTIEKIALKPYEFQPHHYRWMKIIAAIIMAVIIFNMIFGKKIRKAAMTKKPVKRDPLKYDKIIVDEGNARKEIRVKVAHEMVFESARFPDDKRRPLPETATTIDISHKGLAFLSSVQFPKQTDITFRLMETQIAASPLMTGTVVASRPIRKEPGEGKDEEPKWLISLQLRNLNERASILMHRIVTEAEREILARERDERDERDGVVRENEHPAPEFPNNDNS